MLSAVSGLAFLLSTLLKLDNSLGYFLPLPITIAACRSGVAAGWHTMMATAFLLLGEGLNMCVLLVYFCSFFGWGVHVVRRAVQRGAGVLKGLQLSGPCIKLRYRRSVGCIQNPMSVFRTQQQHQHPPPSSVVPRRAAVQCSLLGQLRHLMGPPGGACRCVLT